jgi:Peptidase family C25
MLGRIPANTLAVAQTTIDKIVAYQTQLPAPPGDDFYNHATVTANFEGLGPQDARGFTLSAERMRAGLRSRGHVVTRLNTAQAAADIQRFKDGTAIPEELRRPATPWTDGRDQVVSELNAGRFLFVHRDHGSRLSWANPGISVNDIGLLNSNSTELPVVLAINCSSGGFQFPGNPSLTERMLQRQGGGAVAVIADTDVSPTVQNDQLTVGWADAMFPATVPSFGSAQPLRRMGEILNTGKAYMASLAATNQQLTGNVYREHLLWHLLGDPSMEIRSAEPVAFDTTKLATRFLHRTDAFPVGDPSFRVRMTSTQAGTDGTLATLLHGTEVIGRSTVANGVAEITPTKRTDSAGLSVALERDNFLATTRPVSAPVPNLTMTCASDVNVPTEDNALVSGTLSPRVSGARISLRATRPSGSVTTHSTTTDAASTWKIKIPMGNADIGQVKIEAFFDGAGKYGADDALCSVTVF